MRPRQGFTLIELLVSMALTMFIMVILAETFSTGLEVFGQMKAVGDMQENLRAAATIVREDLAADHFEGKKRLSDPTIHIAEGRPTSGFVRLLAGAATAEGTDPDNIASSRSTGDGLHLSVKRRGNREENYFFASVPTASPLLTGPTTLFFPAAQLPYQNATAGVYSSQWAEVAYSLRQTGSTVERNNAGSTLGTPLYALYRTERVVVPDNSQIAAVLASSVDANRSPYAQMSFTAGGTNLSFNTPLDLTTPANRSIDPTGAVNVNDGSVTLLLTNVVSFQVRALRYDLATSAMVPADLDLPGLVSFDSGIDGSAGPSGTTSVIRAVVVTLRVWDQRTQQTRQITIIQDM